MSDGSVMETACEPLAFVSRGFRGSQLNWAVVHKKAFAILRPIQRFDPLLKDGVDIFADHRNLDYIFNPQACHLTLPRAPSQ